MCIYVNYTTPYYLIFPCRNKSELTELDPSSPQNTELIQKRFLCKIFMTKTKSKVDFMSHVMFSKFFLRSKPETIPTFYPRYKSNDCNLFFYSVFISFCILWNVNALKFTIQQKKVKHCIVAMMDNGWESEQGRSKDRGLVGKESTSRYSVDSITQTQRQWGG